MTVKSTYNFVPAPEEKDVFKPSWANLVSHDIPFSDGESGEIELTITAETPIFIRNGHAEGKEDNEFSHIEINGEKKYFIPGSSLKGMVRNVLEIMSFSRINVENDIFSFRDMTSKTYEEEVSKNRNLKTGWLQKKINGKWIIDECKVGRVRICDIENEFSVSFTDLTAAQKQKALADTGKSLSKSFKHKRDLGLTINDNFIKTGELYEFNGTGSFKGEIVVFGSIDNKKYEYIFQSGMGTTYTVSNDLIKRFEDIDSKLSDTLWRYYKKKKISKIPVFFKVNNGEVEHFGFSRLYKMPNTKYLNELEPLKSYFGRETKYDLDLAVTIFGTVEDTDKGHGTNRNKTALKGRVFFGNAKMIKSGEGQISDVPVVLSSPKASYFPFYLQNNQTYLQESTLKGYKKYPVHNSIKPSELNEESGDIESTIKPLPQGTVFSGKIRFHNLKKVEIGALLSAITFHGNNNNLFHNIGSGKPLGYGKIKLEVVIPDSMDFSIDEYLEAYEKLMIEKHKLNWLESDELKELFSMATNPANAKIDVNLVYPKLKLEGIQPKEANEFVNYKKQGLSLEKYSTDNPPTAILSIAAQLELDRLINHGGFPLETANFDKLQKQLKNDFNDNIPQGLIPQIENAIRKIFANHPASMRKLQKPFETEYKWSIITKWLGHERAKALYKELTGNEE